MIAIKSFLFFLVYLFLIPIIIIYTLIVPKKREKYIWGSTPIINNKYWSEALKQAGYPSMTLMSSFYSINKKEDYDLFYSDLVPRFLQLQPIRTLSAPFFALLYIIRHAKVIHLPFHGGPIGNSCYYRIEGFILRLAKIKTILLPYGADAYQYSQIMDPSVRNGLLTSYPAAAKGEMFIAKRVRYWTKHADCMVTGIMIDGLGRWDVTLPSTLTIETSDWKKKDYYSKSDGNNGVVKILHTPNHRGIKGTEFLIQAVNDLLKEGLQVELILLEKVPNERVKKVMQEVDILAEQFIFTGYALSGIEGMASGLPVLSNLDYEMYTRVFRRYSFLNECPILSTPPERIKDNIRVLVTHPQLRQELGEAGRKYVEKYHSYKTAQYLFGSIYKVILEREDIDLMNLFHPLKSEYVNATPFIKHPLFENRLPDKYYFHN